MIFYVFIVTLSYIHVIDLSVSFFALADLFVRANIICYKKLHFSYVSGFEKTDHFGPHLNFETLIPSENIGNQPGKFYVHSYLDSLYMSVYISYLTNRETEKIILKD